MKEKQTHSEPKGLLNNLVSNFGTEDVRLICIPSKIYLSQFIHVLCDILFNNLFLWA